MNSLILSYIIASTFILQASKDEERFYAKNTIRYSLNDAIPSWVRQLYEKNDTSQFGNETTEVIFFKSLTDTTSYSIHTVSTGTCLRTYVATQKNRRPYTALNIGKECDEELSDPEYSRILYTHDSVHRTILLTFDTEKANPKYLIKTGSTTVFRKGYDMDSGETIHHLTRKIFAITKSGNLRNMNKNGR